MQMEDPLADLRLLEDMDPLWDQEVGGPRRTTRDLFWVFSWPQSTPPT